MIKKEMTCFLTSTKEIGLENDFKLKIKNKTLVENYQCDKQEETTNQDSNGVVGKGNMIGSGKDYGDVNELNSTKSSNVLLSQKHQNLEMKELQDFNLKNWINHHDHLALKKADENMEPVTPSQNNTSKINQTHNHMNVSSQINQSNTMPKVTSENLNEHTIDCIKGISNKYITNRLDELFKPESVISNNSSLKYSNFSKDFMPKSLLKTLNLSHTKPNIQKITTLNPKSINNSQICPEEPKEDIGLAHEDKTSNTAPKNSSRNINLITINSKSVENLLIQDNLMHVHEDNTNHDKNQNLNFSIKKLKNEVDLNIGTELNEPTQSNALQNQISPFKDAYDLTTPCVNEVYISNDDSGCKSNKNFDSLNISKNQILKHFKNSSKNEKNNLKMEKFTKPKKNLIQKKNKKNKNFDLNYTEINEYISKINLLSWKDVDPYYFEKMQGKYSCNSSKILTQGVFWFLVCNRFFRSDFWEKDIIKVITENQSDTHIESGKVVMLMNFYLFGKSSSLGQTNFRYLSRMFNFIKSKSKKKNQKELENYIMKSQEENPNKLFTFSESQPNYFNMFEKDILSQVFHFKFKEVKKSLLKEEYEEFLNRILKIKALVFKSMWNREEFDKNQEQILQTMKYETLAENVRILEEQRKSNMQKIFNSFTRIKNNMQAESYNDQQVSKHTNSNNEDILKDIIQNSKNEQKYLIYMEKQQKNKKQEALNSYQVKTKEKDLKPQTNLIKQNEIICQICTSGDYNDNNQIVFCSKCNVSVHQLCYGLYEVPENDWICELCLVYGESGKYMKCLLCTCRGGAMKEIKVKTTDNFIQKNFPQYYNSISSKELTPINNWDVNTHKGLFYDFYHEKFNFEKDEISDIEPVPENCWVHLSCSLWMPEMYLKPIEVPKKKDRFPKKPSRKFEKLTEVECIEDSVKKSSISREFLHKINKGKYELVGLKNISQGRFGWDCSICCMNNGAVLNCSYENCYKTFHIECAKRSELTLESQNQEHRDFILYCETHTPLKFKKEVEISRKRTRNEIIKYVKHLKKVLKQNFGNETLINIKKNIQKIYGHEEETKSVEIQKVKKKKEIIIKKKQEKKQKLSLIQKISTLRSCEKKLLLNIKKEMSNNKDYFFVWDINMAAAPVEKGAIHEQIRVNIPKKNIYQNKILKSNLVWKKLAKTMGSTSRKLNDKHNKIVTYIRKLKYSDSNLITQNTPFNTVPYSNVPVLFVNNPEEIDDKLYCLCQQKWDGRLMVECDLCENWYHPECIGINEHDDVKLNMMYIICFTCKEKNQMVSNFNNDQFQNNITSVTDLHDKNHNGTNKGFYTIQDIGNSYQKEKDSLFNKLYSEKCNNKKFNALLDFFKENNSCLIGKRQYSEETFSKNVQNADSLCLKKIKLTE